MPIKVIIFDLDGTLFDTRADIVNAVNNTRLSFALEPLPFDRVVAMVGNGMKVLAERSFRDSAVPTEDAAREIYKYYEAHAAETATLYPGVQETLPLLGRILTVVSNKPVALVSALLEQHRIAHHFDYIAGGDTFERLKPDSMAVDFIRERYRVRADEVLIVGDHTPDIEMARRTGTHSIYCRYGFFSRDLVGADAEIEAFSELPALIGELEARCEARDNRDSKRQQGQPRRQGRQNKC
jgi:phosphoglycolate phosphatase